jgi:hypothetical protein
MIRTGNQIFEEELSGEPLTQESVIEAIKIARYEICADIQSMIRSHIPSTKILIRILRDDNLLK